MSNQIIISKQNNVSISFYIPNKNKNTWYNKVPNARFQ